MRLCGLRRKREALFVGLFLFAYAVLTDGHPPVLRAAVTVAAGRGALLLRRPGLPANALALAWLDVLALNPADALDTGCQLSFLCVALLTWPPGTLGERAGRATKGRAWESTSVPSRAAKRPA